MGVYTSIQFAHEPVVGDAATVRIIDAADFASAYFLDIKLDSSKTNLQVKVGDLWVSDIDDTDNTDTLKITADDASGAIIQNSSKITDGNIWEIDHNGAFAAGADVNQFVIDLAGITHNDGAATAITESCILVEGRSMTLTAVTLSTLYGLNLQMPLLTGYATAAGIRVDTVTDNLIFEAVNKSGNVINVAGDDGNAGHTWINVKPTATSITADVNNIFFTIDSTNLTINDGANTPELTGLYVNFDGMTETAVDGTILQGINLDLPDISTYAANSAAFRATEENTNSIVEIINQTNNALLIKGDTVETRNWLEIKPSAASIVAASVINLLNIDTDNWTINDGVTTPFITAINVNLDDMTETAHDGTTLYGIYIDTSADLAGYVAGSCAGYFTDSTRTVSLITATTALAIVGGMTLDLLDLTPTTNADALDINLENNTWVSASAIDIDIGDWTGSAGAGINFEVTQASTLGATDSSLILLNASTLLTLNDAAQDFRGIWLDFDGIVNTLSSSTQAIDIDILPTFTTGISIVSDAITTQTVTLINTSRDITGTIAGVAGFTNYANIFGQAVAHSGGDFVITHDEGILQLVLDHQVTVATAAPDVYSSTALNIAVTGDVNNAGADLDMSARALDISWTVAETLGVTRMADADIARITATIPTGLTSAGAFAFDMLELNADGIILNDVNISFSALKIDASGLTDTAAALSTLINLITPDDSHIDQAVLITSDTTTANAIQDIVTSRDINGTVAGAVALTNYANVFGQAVNHTAGDFVVTQTADTAGIANLVLAHTTSVATTAPDVFSSTALNIDIDATVNTDAGADLDVAARAIDVTYTLTETLGVLRMADTDIARITATIPNGLTSAGAFNFDMLELNADSVVANDANLTFAMFRLDGSGLTDTASAAVYGIRIDVPSIDSALYIDGTSAVNGGNLVSLNYGTPGTIGGGLTHNSIYVNPSTTDVGAGETYQVLYANLDNVTGVGVGNIYGMHLEYTTQHASIMRGEAATTVALFSAWDDTTNWGVNIGQSITSNLLTSWSDFTDANNNWNTLVTSRDIDGVISADRIMTNYSNLFSIINHNEATDDFDLSMSAAAGVLKLQLAQVGNTTVGAKTDADTFAGTALLIDIDGTTTNAVDKLDVSARAIDITYNLTETAGLLQMADSDLFRITATIPDGLSSAGAFNFDMAELNADAVVCNDANLSFAMLKLDASALTQTASASTTSLKIATPTAARMRDRAIDADGPIVAKHPEWMQFHYEEDFGDVAGALVATNCHFWWAETTDGANGTADILPTNIIAPGVMSLNTTALANSWVAMTWQNAFFEADFYHEMEVRFALSSIATCTMDIGWRVGVNDYAILHFDTTTDAANLYLASNNNAGGEELDDTTCDLVATQWYKLKLSIKNTTIKMALYDETAATWYDVTPVNCDIRNLNTFVPYIYIDNKAVAAQKILSVDYIRVFADRS